MSGTVGPPSTFHIPLKRQRLDHGIRATAICPGVVATDMTADIRDPMLDNMNHPGAIAQLVATVLTLPNPTAGVGRVINIVSLSGKRVTGASVAGYCMSKFATSALTHSVRFSAFRCG